MSSVIKVSGAVVAALAGGAILSLVDFPVAWLVGAMLGMAAYNQLSASPFQPPRTYRRLGEWVLGATVGAGLKLEVVTFFVTGGVPVLIALGMTIGTGVLSGLLLRRMTTLAPSTCFYASVPGGAAEMTALADGAGADSRLVASLHALRVGLIVATLPLALSPLGEPARAAAMALNGSSHSWPDMMLLLAAAGLGGWLAFKYHVPGGVILGAMLGASLVSVVGFSHGTTFPGIFKNGAQAVIGAYAGAAFTRETWRQMARVLSPALAMITFMVLMGLATGAFLHWAAGLDWITALLGTVPAGSAEMITAAAALGADVGIVAAIQVVRVIAMNLVFPILIPRLLKATD